MRGRILLLLGLFVFTSAPTAGCGETARDEAGTFDEIPRLVREVEPSVVAVLARGAQAEGQGSGVIVRRDGLIVTNAHVVDGAQSLEIGLASGDRVPARLVAADRRIDRGDLPAARFVDDLPAVGELAIAVGNPLGFENSVTAGIVSGLNRSIPSGGQTIQTDAPISPGNSGGALLGDGGRVIGINVAYIPPEARAESIGFAIPGPRVRDAVDELLSRGRVTEAFLGVVLTPLSPQIAERFGLREDGGAIILAVEPRSPAARSGLGPGDVIVGVDGRPVEAVEQVQAALRRATAADRMRLTVARAGTRREITVTLAER